jgi:hypothetical protein
MPACASCCCVDQVTRIPFGICSLIISSFLWSHNTEGSGGVDGMGGVKSGRDDEDGSGGGSGVGLNQVGSTRLHQHRRGASLGAVRRDEGTGALYGPLFFHHGYCFGTPVDSARVLRGRLVLHLLLCGFCYFNPADEWRSFKMCL